MNILMASEENISIIKDITAKYNSKFEKFGYGWFLSDLYIIDFVESTNMFMFEIPALVAQPFGLSGGLSTSHISFDNKNIVYDIVFPNHAESEKEIDNVLNGLENIIKAKAIYDDYVDEVLKLTK